MQYIKMEFKYIVFTGAMMKNVLCALMEPNEYLLKRIHEFGREHDWQIERCGRAVPRGWAGDGIISDYLELDDFAPLDRFERIPTVSRLLPPRGNIRTIRPDTVKIAGMIADYFTGKGFSRFATVAGKIFQEDIDGVPRDVLKALECELQSRGFRLECLLWEKESPDGDYRKQQRKLRSFFRKLEKPFALILPSSANLPLVYRTAEAMKLRVPEEMALLSNTDDWSVTENAFVPTSYISGEFPMLGGMLAELLDRMMRQERLPEAPVFMTPSSIVSRRSTDTLAVSDIRLAKAVSFFLQNYMNLISVEDAAREAGISHNLLIRLFRQQFGKSPLRFLQETRFNQIRHLLDSTVLSLGEIASKTGYGSDMALSLAFKRETGGTPGAYRESRRHME